MCSKNNRCGAAVAAQPVKRVPAPAPGGAIRLFTITVFNRNASICFERHRVFYMTQVEGDFCFQQHSLRAEKKTLKKTKKVTNVHAPVVIRAGWQFTAAAKLVGGTAANAVFLPRAISALCKRNNADIKENGHEG